MGDEFIIMEPKDDFEDIPILVMYEYGMFKEN